jgi:hypothetical protein
VVELTIKQEKTSKPCVITEEQRLINLQEEKATSLVRYVLPKTLKPDKADITINDNHSLLIKEVQPELAVGDIAVNEADKSKLSAIIEEQRSVIVQEEEPSSPIVFFSLQPTQEYAKTSTGLKNCH